MDEKLMTHSLRKPMIFSPFTTSSLLSGYNSFSSPSTFRSKLKTPDAVSVNLQALPSPESDPAEKFAFDNNSILENESEISLSSKDVSLLSLDENFLEEKEKSREDERKSNISMLDRAQNEVNLGMCRSAS